MSSPPVAPAVVLRDVTGADVAVFLEQQADPEASRMAAFPMRDRATHFAHWARILADPSLYKQTVECDGRVAGNVVSFPLGGQQLVGYWLGRDFWGRRVATRALAAFLPQLPMRPLHARVAKHNVASRRVLEKCGFVLAGEDRGSASPGEHHVEEWIFRYDAPAATDGPGSAP